MATVVIIANGMALQLVFVVDTNPIRVYLVLCKALIHSNSHLKQLYSSNKTVRFSYMGGCGVRECMRIEMLKMS